MPEKFRRHIYPLPIAHEIVCILSMTQIVRIEFTISLQRFRITNADSITLSNCDSRQIDTPRVVGTEIEDIPVLPHTFHALAFLRSVCFHTTQTIAPQTKAGSIHHLHRFPLCRLVVIVNERAIIQVCIADRSVVRHHPRTVSGNNHSTPFTLWRGVGGEAFVFVFHTQVQFQLGHTKRASNIRLEVLRHGEEIATSQHYLDS